MSKRVLHILSQRPQLTGSGVTLEALVACANRAGWKQAAVIGIPTSATPKVAGIAADDLYPVLFETAELPMAVPGMSDTMPYPSTRFSSMAADAIERYSEAFRQRIESAIAAHRPDVIHCNHIWLATAAAKAVAGRIPLAVHCHGTGLRQLTLCPGLAPGIIEGVRTCQRFFALHRGQADALIETLAVPADAVKSIGAGYRQDVFYAKEPREPRVASHPPQVSYAGKLARSKGVPWLIEAATRLSKKTPLTLSLAGGGDNDDARQVRALAGSSPITTLCGRLDQTELAELLRATDVFVLPSFFEGLPLVLVEALASGARLVANDLQGVRELAPALGDRIDIVPMPRLIGADEPHPDDLASYTASLADAIERALGAPRLPPPPAEMLEALSWEAVFGRIEPAWLELVRDPG